MLMVGDFVAMHAVLVEDLGHGVIEGLQRTPTAMQEIVTSGVQLAPGWHTGHAANEGFIKGDASLRQAREIRRMHPIAAVRLHQPAIQ